MKRLLKISFDLSLLSFVPILSWFLIGIIVDKNLINIFTLTYPFQFICYIIKSVFSTGANISKEKDNNKNAVMSGIIIGSLISILIFGIILLNIDKYIIFMNMDIEIYKTFTIYSILAQFLSLEFAMILDKLYYEENNTLANKYSIIFNLLYFLLLIATSLITKKPIVIICATLIPLTIFTLYIVIKNSNKFKLKLNLFNCVKYNSVELFNNISYFIIFLFGLSNALEFGEEYTIALTFISLITDTQWDTINAIVTSATIDISKNKFNYKEHIKNAYKLLGILYASSIILFILLYNFYDLNLKITLIYFSLEIISFAFYPIYRINICYLQLEWSAFKITTNKVIATIIRFAISLFKTPFCTSLGQVGSCIYQFITYSLLFNNTYKINEFGNLNTRKKLGEKYENK